MGYFFLITYHQSLLSIHSTCSFIPAILTILRLHFGLFFFNNLSPPPFIHSIKAAKRNALCRLLRRHFPYVTHNAPISHRRGLLFRLPPYCGPLLYTRSILFAFHASLIGVSEECRICYGLIRHLNTNT